VHTAKSIRVVLEATLDDSGSISGALRADNAPPLGFSGWIGLVAAIDAAAGRPPVGSSAPTRRDLLDGRLDPTNEPSGPTAGAFPTPAPLQKGPQR
jgi:hypothetical protein